ncbi:hypothetical protein G7046_g6069 [Stylonectria norvegica]|nr:hypothetical protein G7046_g6069 [Stylonectria norvegica]
MDPDHVVIKNVRDVVGCNGVRNFTDLGKMKQITLEKRLTAARPKLSSSSMMSIYAVWVRDQTFRVGGAERTYLVKVWCDYLASWGCPPRMVLSLWEDFARQPPPRFFSIDQERLRSQMNAVGVELEKYYPPRPRDIDTPSRTTAAFALGPKDQNAQMTYSESRTYQDDRMEQKRSLSPFQIRKNMDTIPLVMDLKDDCCNESSNTSAQGSDNGHFIQDCPTNSDPTWDSRPKPDYTCRRCGKRGHHYITACPKKTQRRSTSTSRSEPDTPKEEGELMGRVGHNNTLKGRLSPWEETNTYSSTVSEAPRVSCEVGQLEAIRTAEDFLVQFRECLELESPDATLPDLSSFLEEDEASTTSAEEPRNENPSKRQKISAASHGALGMSEPWTNDTFNQDICNNESWTHDTWMEGLDSPQSSSISSDGPRDLEALDTPSPRLAPQPVVPILLYVSQKSLLTRPSYDAAVIRLFGYRPNVWVNRACRETALDMWDARED